MTLENPSHFQNQWKIIEKANNKNNGVQSLIK